MAFDITQFRSSFRKEPQLSNAFDVFVFPPPALLPMFAITDARSFNLRCTGINIPGKMIRTIDFMHGGYGPLIKIANASAYDEIQLEIIMTQGTLERQMMLAWAEFIQPTNTYNTSVKYFDSYVGNAIITCYDSEGKANHLVRIQNCFPVAISSLSMGWNSTNQPVTFRVAMAQERVQVISPLDLPGGAASVTPWPEIGQLTQLIGNFSEGLADAVNGIASVIPKI